jgi:manganese/zinc/iron transport system permease protein
VLFSGGVILIARYADDVHLDVDAVLLGELAFAPFDRVILGGWDLGPKGLWVMGTILVLNILLIALFYKELKLASFDAGLAVALGLSPAVVHYGLMSMVSVTAVGAFDAVGSILVVALMIAPPATAYLLTDRLGVMLVQAAVVGVVSAISGYWVAHWLDAPIAGSMAAAAGVLFSLAWLLAPERGLVALARRHRRQRWEFAQAMLAIHLLNHEDSPDAAEESRIEHLTHHLRWEPEFAGRVVRGAARRGLVMPAEGRLLLTERGRTLARDAVLS